MRKIILKTVVVLGLILTYGLSNGQTAIENCPKKGTAQCPLVNKSQGTETVNQTASTENMLVSDELANCPFAGTPDCPLIKNCPKKGTADCPYTKSQNNSGLADNSE